ncbi:multidrug resistance-associated protein 1-like [Cimex lectularius]|uniref:ABC Transporter n=1 Tax=Cimex lectularius TaxID=79782 RepID=A0A8I6TER1_CIMLE|nr:multidrug resistance-associated protein 1-like [Cimex lectularius]XP_014250193.1 multidrug resistance-associated protein 1-like [Cimex lectularius]XP_014250194.1 multidrug resistance-associated protein 1-like [Cimex lectularius]XP_014250195.1 multidrug resistance-associated protein 1-like [Cimex lectularius]XP_014250196.1 multidrug resistance-associated protein 1-like [Cimex lectularius]XP_014250197.1 multidrug resistance-associated protein 1-like [Cimex lectularius]XP_024085967.1 multidru
MEEGLYHFCGSKFWDANLTWYTDTPELTPCLEKSLSILVPFLFVILFIWIDIYDIVYSNTRNIPWSQFNKMKLLLCSGILILGIIDFVYIVITLNKGFVFPVDLCTSLVKIVLMIVSITLILVHREKGIRSSGLLFLMWTLLVILAVPQLGSVIKKYILNDYILIDITFFVYFAFALVSLGLNFFADAEPLHADYPEVTNPCPEYNASFPSQLFFTWFDSFIFRGYRQPLTNSDLWNMNYEDMSRAVIPQFDKYWNASVQKKTRLADKHNAAISKGAVGTNEAVKKEKAEPKPTSILPCLCKCFGPTFLYGAFLRLVQVLLSFVSPLILKLLIEFVEGDEPEWKGYLYAAVLLITATIQSILLSQYFKKMILIGLRIRSSLISIIYRKALKLSNAARKGSTVGEIVNLMSVDAQRFMDLVTFLNLLWTVPLTIALALYFLWQTLGPSVMAGFAVMIILIPINGVIGSKVRSLQVIQMKNKDERIKMMNEILSGIKVLKLYAWEPSFEKQVMNIREKEIKVLKQASYLNAFSSFLWACAPFLVALVTFTVYVLSDEKNILDAQKAFVALSLFNMIKFPLAMLPMLIASMIQTSVSIKRINKFMNSEEIDPSCVSHDNKLEEALLMEDGSFKWGAEDSTILKNINMKIKPKSLVAIVGSVGSGKSSLLSAFLGEMEKISGRVNTKGSIAYVPQIAWIQNATLRENILFGNAYNSKLYEKVITACALKADFEMLPAGDRTEIGEKGINLSGGQKQRVSLARAVYYNSDIYFLDDPLSAVDSHVGKHIFDNIIGPNGILHDKTRLLVTHSITFLPEVDFIIVLKDGSVSETGTYRELLDKKGAFSEFLTTHTQDIDKNKGRDEEMASASQMELSRQISVSSSMRRRKPSTHSSLGSVSSEEFDDKLIEEEKTEEGSVKWQVYRHYFKSSGMFLAIATIFLTILNQGFSIGSNFWISIWTSDKALVINGTQDTSKRDMYLGVYGLFGTGEMLALMLSSLTMALGCIYASIGLHIYMLNNILHSPISFFDTTPIGRIVNRFAKDIDIVDNALPPIIRGFIYTFFGVISTLIVISASTPIFITVIIPVGLLYYFIQKFFIATSRQLKRLESVTRSPIYSHFGETVNGSSSIRAYNVQQRFVKESEEKVDFNQIAAFPGIIANRWLAVRLEFIGNVIIFFAALFAVLERETMNPGIVGLSITYALQITQTLNWLVRMTAEVETNIVAVERIKEYGETPQEAPWEVKPNPVDQNWPINGAIEFRKFKVRYREGLDLVLKGLSFKINGNEKVGIVGRTGAGKSSMTLSLFRIIEAAEGTILIDNVDISKVGLHTLRSRITIIPQDPVLFSGPLRFNLDPFESYNDEQIWKVLELAHLKNYVTKLPNKLQYNVTEGGDNLSVGQKQLICLARALLRKSKLLILDEATAAVDLETDKLIQETIRAEFTNCTILTIAHRINTIMDSDRVLVLDKGSIAEFDNPKKLLKNKKSIFYGMAKDAGLAS